MLGFANLYLLKFTGAVHQGFGVVSRPEPGYLLGWSRSHHFGPAPVLAWAPA